MSGSVSTKATYGLSSCSRGACQSTKSRGAFGFCVCKRGGLGSSSPLRPRSHSWTTSHLQLTQRLPQKADEWRWRRSSTAWVLRCCVLARVLSLVGGGFTARWFLAVRQAFFDTMEFGEALESRASPIGSESFVSDFPDTCAQKPTCLVDILIPVSTAQPGPPARRSASLRLRHCAGVKAAHFLRLIRLAQTVSTNPHSSSEFHQPRTTNMQSRHMHNDRTLVQAHSAFADSVPLST